MTYKHCGWLTGCCIIGQWRNGGHGSFEWEEIE